MSRLYHGFGDGNGFPEQAIGGPKVRIASLICRESLPLDRFTLSDLIDMAVG
jgi:hypothetical protein